MQWLSNNQAPNGSFPEVGRVSHRDMQGGAAKGLTLTAFTLIAFLENAVSIIYLILWKKIKFKFYNKLYNKIIKNIIYRYNIEYKWKI